MNSLDHTSSNLGGYGGLCFENGRIGLIEFAEFDCNFLLDALVDSIDNKPIITPMTLPSSSSSSSFSSCFSSSSSSLSLLLNDNSDCHASQAKAEVKVELPVTRQLR